MLDSDISTADAVRLLRAPERPGSLDRRRFLQLLGMGVGAGLAIDAVDNVIPARIRDAWALTPTGVHDGIVVLIGLFGGVDGLNVVVPYANPLYYQQHATAAIAANQTLHLNSAVGLHPSLKFMKSLYDQGHVAVVQGVGYPNPDLSHFNSMMYWMSARPNAADQTTGWVGRWLDGLGPNLFRAVSIGQGLPLHLIGAKQRGISVPSWGGGFATGTGDEDKLMYAAMRAFAASPGGEGAWRDTLASTVKGMIDVGQTIAPAFERPTPDDDIAKQLTVAARLINADIGVRVIDTSFGGFDTHATEPTDLAAQLTSLDNGLKAFFTSLDDRFRTRVTIMTYSEFGRTSWSNDSHGTDHGTANNHFIIGNAVKGGLYGTQPSLAGLQQWDRMDYHVDFRRMYASVIDTWLGGGSSTVLGGSYSNLGVFKHGPGAGVAAGGVPAYVVGDYVSLTPARLYDSRTARAGMKVGAGTSGEVQVLGKGGVPLTGVTAVALRATPINNLEPSRVWMAPLGGPHPDVTTTTAPTGFANSGLSLVKPGVGGRVVVTNDLGATDVVVDVVGYFRSTAANRLGVLTPGRVLDTRSGLGTSKGAIAGGHAKSFLIRGVKGVPTATDSVVLNVTVLGGTANGALTLYPSGTTRPGLATLQYLKGATASHLEVVKVGKDGRIAVFNSTGSAQVVIEVVGYLGPHAVGRYMPITPNRIASATGVGPTSTPTPLKVLGITGVPATHVSAVVLNVCVRNADSNTTISAWPNGAGKPVGSIVTASPKRDAANLAVVKPGVGGKVVFTNAAGNIDIDIDVVGYFTG